MAAARLRLLVLMVYYLVIIPNNASNEVESFKMSKLDGNIGLRKTRQSDTDEEQFCCWLPWNETMVQPYITCGVLDRRQRRPFGVPVYSDAGEPNFSEAKYCVNDTQSVRPATQTDSEEEATWCTNGPSDDCRVKCVYNSTGVFNAQGRPEKLKLFTHWLKRLNSIKGFKLHIKNAVNICLGLHDQMIREHGSSKVDMCVLQSQMHYCIEEVVGRFCPRRFRRRMLLDEVCEES